MLPPSLIVESRISAGQVRVEAYAKATLKTVGARSVYPGAKVRDSLESCHQSHTLRKYESR
jgi:hypothetical protein